MPSYLITGASRGLGFETAKQLLALPDSESITVFASSRDPRSSTDLQRLLKDNPGKLHLVTLDTTSQISISSAVSQVSKIVGDLGLDVLINNAGVLAGGAAPFSLSDKDSLIADISTNLYGVINTTTAFLPLLRKGGKKQIFVTSSVMGSTGHAMGKTPFAISYSVSKAAVNMWTIKVANEIGPDGFTVIPFHPGYVKTDLNGGTGGDITPQESVGKTLKNIILKVTPKDNGRFLSFDGKEIPW